MRADLDRADPQGEPLDPQLLQRLRNLSDAEPPPYEFTEFSRRYSHRRLQTAQRPLRLVAAATAVILAGWVVRHGLTPFLGQMSEVANAPAPQLEAPVAAPDAQADAMARWPVLLPTTNAENWLNNHPRQAVVQVPAQMAVTELEDQIATMDDQLNAVRLSQAHAQQLALLQRDRAQLVESLAQVRYAQNLVAGLP